jgi:hypothetical protein
MKSLLLILWHTSCCYTVLSYTCISQSGCLSTADFNITNKPLRGQTFGGIYNKEVGAVLITASRVRVNGYGILGGFFLMVGYSHLLRPFTRHWNVLYAKLSIRKERGKGSRQHDQDRRRVAIEFHS